MWKLEKSKNLAMVPTFQCLVAIPFGVQMHPLPGDPKIALASSQHPLFTDASLGSVAEWFLFTE